ncbi:HAD family hydrolase [Pontibacter cellulosilyticus]|uniref:HAD family hydrolase n=1 Tax=Pontibacter cellulosilyticus TaxID=1720253 RepID=UPI001C9B3131|nr:HAD family hydrolase [Pontibacter cellulosilyticus]
MLQNTGLLYDTIVASGKSIVIFDIFDTIIHRKSHPEDLKKIFSNRLINYLSLGNYTSEQMYGLRAQGERELCLANSESGYDLEFRFNDLCGWLYNSLKHNFDSSFTEADFTKIAREIEYTVEVTNQYLDENVVATIQKLKREGYTVLCCSDFYLDLDFIKRFLLLYEIDDQFDKIFVSSEYLLTKRSGRLYSLILQDYAPQQSLMIGDNAESDCRQAEYVGINSILLDRAWAQLLHGKYNSNFNSKYFTNKIDAVLATDDNTLFGEFALTSFYFIHKLHLELVAKGYKDAFFLAREGQVLKEMYDIYQNTCIKNNAFRINAHYLMASRRSTFMPSLEKLEKEKFFNLFRQYINISFAEFMYSLGFNDSTIDQLSEKLSISKHKRERDFPRSETFIRLLISDDFYDLYKSRRVEQKENFKNYLSQFEVKQPDRLALVDVGWKGTIQDNIYKILDGEVAVDGLYIGLVVPTDNTNNNNTKSGLLFSKDLNRPFQDIYDENRSLFEVLFAANHGSVVSFNKADNGSITVETEDFSQEVKFYKDNILPVIERIKMIYKNICAEYAKSSVDISVLDSLVAKHHSRMVLFPSKKELEWHLDLYHVENFGVFERNIFNKEKSSLSVLKKFENYLDYKKNPDKITKESIWPAAEFAKGGLFKSMSKYSSDKYNTIFNK